MEKIQGLKNVLTEQPQTGTDKEFKNVVHASFKAQAPDTFVRQPSLEEQRMRAIQQHQKEQQSQKRKQNVSTWVTIGAGLAIIASVIMGAISMKKVNGGKMEDLGGLVEADFKKMFVDVSKERSFDRLFLEENSANKLKEIRSRIADAALYKDRNLPETIKAMLLFGPPGTGKNSFTYALAKELGAEVFSMDMSKIIGPYAGMPEKNLQAVTEYILKYAAEMKAKNPGKKLILFMDEIDRVIMRDFSSSMQHSDGIMSEFKQCFNRLYEADNIIIIGATNKEVDAAKGLAEGMGMLDPNMLNRFGDKIRVNLPKPEAVANAIVDRFKGAKYIDEELLDPNNKRLLDFLNIITGEKHGFSFRTLNLELLPKITPVKGQNLSVNDLIDAALKAKEGLLLSEADIKALEKLKAA